VTRPRPVNQGRNGPAQSPRRPVSRPDPAPGCAALLNAAARVKTDAVDACMLAHLLRTDLLPEAYVAPRVQSPGGTTTLMKATDTKPTLLRTID
jgi:hypothetical protein